jgi:SAM-dependent methyltransferase
MHSRYDDHDRTAAEVAAGGHREVIGGLWDEIGALQLNWLIANGMTPNHRLLDIGCGALRLGAKAVPFLNPGHYFGCDLNDSLVEAGWNLELDAPSRAKTPRQNLNSSPDFNFEFLPELMDYGIAQSVFTHLPFNNLRRCLIQAWPHFRIGGRLYVTAFLIPQSQSLVEPQEQVRDGIVTHDDRDPFHYWPGDFAYAAASTPWRTTVIGDWNHPRGQAMILYERQ